MEYERIKYSTSEGAASIVLNNPDNLNAMDGPMLDELSDVLDKCMDDDSVRVVVLSGEGDSFSAGGDIKQMMQILQGEEVQGVETDLRKLGTVALKIRNLKKPVIASVKGAVAGAGLNLALLCDFRVAADNVKFIQAFVKIGLVPDMGGIFLLTRMLGAARATELVMTGRTVGAEEAFSLGLVNKVVAAEDLAKATEELTGKLLALPGIALGKIKTLINRAVFCGFEKHLDNETEFQLQCTGTEDFVEGVRAFVEKRKPQFQNK